MVQLLLLIVTIVAMLQLRINMTEELMLLELVEVQIRIATILELLQVLRSHALEVLQPIATIYKVVVLVVMAHQKQKLL